MFAALFKYNIKNIVTIKKDVKGKKVVLLFFSLKVFLLSDKLDL